MISIELTSDHPHTIILNGFDRSGTSAISRSLATHPKIELFMQPFNSGPVRKKMYHIWTDEIANDQDTRFFEGLENGVLQADYIQSHWFKEYSTAQSFVSGHLHVVKTTINHFLIDWCQRRFPRLHQWAIWRDPWEILDSIMRNDFASQWYQDAINEIVDAVTTSEILAPHYSQFFKHDLSSSESVALLIAVRNHFLFYHVHADKVLFFHEFQGNKENYLNSFCSAYGLESIEFSAGEKDLNIIGKGNEKRGSAIAALSAQSKARINEIFSPLLDLMTQRFPSQSGLDGE